MTVTNPLVAVFLRGGMDGLSLLPPLGEARYADLRPTLRVPEVQVLPVDDRFGLHPALPRLAEHAADGRVAFVPAAALVGQSRSHFEAQFRAERAQPPSGETPAGGWLGRALAATGDGAANPFRGVSFGQPLTPMLLAGSADVIAGASLDAVRLGGRRGARTADAEVLRRLWVEGASGPLREASVAAFTALDRAAALARGSTDGSGADPAEDPAAAEPGAVADTVRVLRSDLGTEVAVLNLGGWDHHRDEGVLDGQFAALAGGLDRTLDTLLRQAPAATILVLSEFGRRVAENASAGTDHGRGGVVIVAGAGVRGGVHGAWPGLDDLDDGDVPAANDVRAVQAEVARAVLGAEAAKVVPGAPAELGLLE